MTQLMRRVVTKYWWQLELLSFVVLSLIWILPWGFSGKIYLGDDLGFHLNRIQGLAKAIQLSGNWWQIPAVSTAAFSGWGYPINLFYPAAALLPAAWLQTIASGVGGYYVFLVLLNVLTLWVAAMVAARLLPSRAQAFLAAVIYGFAQYRFLDFFVRGSLAEGIVFTFLPLIFYGVYSITIGDYHKWPWLAVGMALIALTHVISLVLSSVGVIIMLSLWGLRRKELRVRGLRFGAAAGLAVLLSLSFLGPLVEQLRHVGKLGIAQYTLADSATHLGDLLWNSLNDAVASNAINFGVLLLVTSVLAIIVWRQLRPFDRYCLVLGGIFVFLATNLFPWPLFQGLLGTIQFPWRFLAMADFPLALVGARAVMVVTRAKTFQRTLMVVPVVTAIAVGLSFSASATLYRSVGPNNAKVVTNATYLANATRDTTTDYVAQRGLVSMAAVRTHSIPVMNTQPNGQQPASLQQLAVRPVANGLVYTVKSTTAQEIKLPQLDYYGYHVFVNGREQTPRLDSNGVVHIHVNTGTSQIRYVYQRTTVQYLTSGLTWLAWISLIGVGCWRWLQRQRRLTAKN
ncbi:hypothetical protein [Levilactobacillus acidifarinae]|uniref:Membrane protein 6-pyruvoyl-tetrahydropterin synthase-related domain-containing protein n=1 Tax=Levilactobacillus acidifarinae DSM 19394 = JCM 15949 TaxID=1423715 RepID=A0A0R1LQF9_9LACO|nr:hypothetical protein [Levilactobacillus acidifarinae]KRK94985.1 hypothetical protein FD25_GL002170 [Levilactobacillus acidifarinae DSM 19394]GEO70086.1 membrane protein [Levilactobacillus acidifarinae]